MISFLLSRVFLSNLLWLGIGLQIDALFKTGEASSLS